MRVCHVPQSATGDCDEANARTICVSRRERRRHLNKHHCDTRGRCQTQSTTTSTSTTTSSTTSTSTSTSTTTPTSTTSTSTTPMCIPLGSPCTDFTQCCSNGLCVGETCCATGDQACNADSECCSGNCDTTSGTCVCRPNRSPCTDPAQCCSDNCLNDVCCAGLVDSCETDEDCCTHICDDGQCWICRSRGAPCSADDNQCCNLCNIDLGTCT